MSKKLIIFVLLTILFTAILGASALYIYHKRKSSPAHALKLQEQARSALAAGNPSQAATLWVESSKNAYIPKADALQIVDVLLSRDVSTEAEASTVMQQVAGILSSAISGNMTDNELFERVTKILVRQGKASNPAAWQNLKSLCDSILAKHPDNAPAKQFRALAEFNLNQWQKAQNKSLLLNRYLADLDIPDSPFQHQSDIAAARLSVLLTLAEDAGKDRDLSANFRKRALDSAAQEAQEYPDSLPAQIAHITTLIGSRQLVPDEYIMRINVLASQTDAVKTPPAELVKLGSLLRLSALINPAQNAAVTEYYQKALSLYPHDPALRADAAFHFLQAGEDQNALGMIDQLLKDNSPRPPLDWMERGVIRAEAAFRYANHLIDQAAKAATPEKRDELLSSVPKILEQSAHSMAPVQIAMLQAKTAFVQGNFQQSMLIADQIPPLQGAEESERLFLSAESAIRLGLIGEAKERYRKIIISQGVSFPARLRFSQLLLQTGEYDILENQLSSFSKDEKNHPAVMELQADFLMARGKNAEAFAVYDQMLKKTAEEGKSSVLLKKAMAAMRTGKNDVAVKTLNEALAQDPANVHAVKMYLLTANQTDAAKRVVSRAAEAGAPPILTDLFGHLLTRKNWNFEKMAISGIQSSRPGPGMYHETARAYLALGESDKAMTILAEGYKLYPADSTLLEIQFDQALALKDEKAIAKILETARDKNADGVHGLYFQAIYLASQGQTAEARSLSSDIARKVPSHNGNQLLLAKLDIEAQDFTAAKNRLERAISADPSFAPALSLLSDLEFREGQDEAALNYIKRALTQDPQNAVYLAQFLSIQQAKLPAQNVLEIRKKIAEAAPDFTQNTQELSLMFLDQGRIEEALQTARIDTITDKSPFSQRAFKAQVLAATGKTKEALSLYESLSKESPDKTDIAARHTFLLIMNGDFDAALTRIATTRKSARRDDILLVEESLAHQNKALNARNRPEALKSLEAAITVLSRHVTLHASDARNHLQLARLKIAAGYPVDAVQPDIDRAIQANPSFPEAVILKSELDFQKGATSQAIEVLRAAIQSNPDHRGYYLRLHDYYRATGQSRHSQQALDEAIRRFPNDADLHTQRMLHHLSVDELSPAVKDAERAFTLSPAPGTLANYAQANLRAGNRPLARKIMAEHQPLVDSSPVLLSLQARMLAEDGDLSAATGILQRLFEENQHEGTARMILENARQAIGAEATEKILASTKSKLPPETQKILHIQFLLQSGQIPKAAQILSDYPFSALKDRLNILIPLVLQTTQALPLSDSDTLLQKYSSAAPDNPILLFARARNRAAAGDMPSAKNLIAEAEKSAPREARLALIELLLAQMAQSKDDATRDRIGYETNLQLDHLMRAYPDDPNLPLLKAAYLIENKKLKEAAEAAETILKNDPASSRAAIMLSRIRMEQGEKMKAVGEAEFFLSRFPQDITVRRHLAAILREVDQRKFNDFLNSSLRLFPADTVLLTFKAEIESEKNKPAAIEYYKKALFQNPTNPLLLNNLAYLQSQTKDLNDALANALKAKELAPQDPYILDTLGRIQFLKGDLKSAQETLERSLFFKPLPDTCLHLAELHIRAGDKARAREYLNQAKSLAGDEKNHREKIASLEKEL